MVNQVVAELTFSEKQAIKAINSLTKSVDKNADVMEKSLKQVDSEFNKLTKSFIVGTISADAIKNAFRGIIRVGQEVLETFIDIEKAQIGVAKTTDLS